MSTRGIDKRGNVPASTKNAFKSTHFSHLFNLPSDICKCHWGDASFCSSCFKKCRSPIDFAPKALKWAVEKNVLHLLPTQSVCHIVKKFRLCQCLRILNYLQLRRRLSRISCSLCRFQLQFALISLATEKKTIDVCSCILLSSFIAFA